ncbi:enolase C-terminal domain-like protein [Purpureocillium lavendulum]|uniref:Enolase C-terminal domain-like protein n=1 Tax=Purpureocillium lavendulum TaxID=1247861 RepID=A0AB34FTT5_9HYPO|nr:enolase C-terminal domain-like protein [Purpureocillium lavendulum]
MPLPEDATVVVSSPLNRVTSPATPGNIVPEVQDALLLHGPGQQYQIHKKHPVPRLVEETEVLVKTTAIGLNPIDWKAPDYNFGIPSFPFISGRELSGTVCQVNAAGSRFSIGDQVIAISTDYRDYRKSAYQQYVLALEYNLVRIPKSISLDESASIGVAFVTSALALGVCLGIDFSNIFQGPDLFTLVRSAGAAEIPDDVSRETLSSLEEHERAQPGDWLAVWGGSATSANLTIQLARLVGLRVVVIVDQAKHGSWISQHPAIRPDVLVDSQNAERAVEIIRASTGGKVRFAIDTRGRESASHLLRALSANVPATGTSLSPPSTPPQRPRNESRAHLVGLTGLPKEHIPSSVSLHTVPVKLFHEVAAVGRALTSWLERLLEAGQISAPRIIDVEDGLERVNPALDRMRRGEISGGKLIVRV